jgi:hypothetical protein
LSVILFKWRDAIRVTITMAETSGLQAQVVAHRLARLPLVAGVSRGERCRTVSVKIIMPYHLA